MAFPFEQLPIKRSSSPHPHERSARYRAYFFGPFRVFCGQQSSGEIVLHRSKARKLLKLFLLNPGKLFPIDQLCTFCWPAAEEAKALGSLHVTIHDVRHGLEPDLLSHQRSTFIRRNTHNCYWFDPCDLWWSDVFEVQRMHLVAKEAEALEDAATALACYRTLLDYYRAGFLPEDMYEDLFTSYRNQYTYAHTYVLERSMQLASQLRLTDEVMTYVLQALSIDPYNETAMREMINELLLQGNTAGAIHQLSAFQAVLRQDLNASLGPTLLSLRKKLLYEEV